MQDWIPRASTSLRMKFAPPHDSTRKHSSLRTQPYYCWRSAFAGSWATLPCSVVNIQRRLFRQVCLNPDIVCFPGDVAGSFWGHVRVGSCSTKCMPAVLWIMTASSVQVVFGVRRNQDQNGITKNPFDPAFPVVLGGWASMSTLPIGFMEAVVYGSHLLFAVGVT